MADDKRMQEGDAAGLPLLDDGLERDLRAILGVNDAGAEKPPEAPSQPTPASDSGQQQPGQAQQAQQAQPEPTVKIGDEEVPLSQVREWRLGYLRMQDYTRKTQEVARQQQELERQRQELQPLLTLAQMLRTNPAAAAVFSQAWQAALQQVGTGPVGAAGASGTPAGPVVSPPLAQDVLLREFQETQQRLADIELDRELAQVQQEINAWRRSVGLPELQPAQWEEVSQRLMREALDSEQTDLRKVWRASDLRAEWLHQREQQLLAQRQQQSQLAGHTLRGSPPAQPAPPAPTPRSFAEAAKLAAQDPLVRELYAG